MRYIFLRSAIADWFSALGQAWKTELSNRNFRFKLLLAPGLFFVYSAITQHIGNFVETRRGVRLHDKFLTLFPAIDFSTPVFILLYSSLAAIILLHIHKPKVILRVIEMHLFVAIVRQVCILLLPLEPPLGLILLRDTFLENTVYPHNTPLTKDLFFSGHVASLWIYFLCAEFRYLKAYFLFGALLMSFMVLSMRIHYTYDVYGAMLFTTIIFYAPTKARIYYTKVKERLA